ncbi:MAG: sulfite exporter TauE/SafE family protein [Nanoarchaeota archaeon]|nr:sulfite exporter TauE/SafE family protein [Nanoarchaeota archaeon]
MKKIYKIKGMSCNSCGMLIERTLKDKVNDISASFSKEEAGIDFDENKISEKDIVEEIEKLGYEVVNKEEESNKEDALMINEKNNEEEKEIEKNELIETPKINYSKTKKPKNTEKKELSKKVSEEPDTKKKFSLSNYSTSDKIGFVFAILSLVLLIFILYHFFIGHIKIPEVALPQGGEKVGLVLLFLIGILTGFHCVSMCGGFVVSYTAKNAMNGHKSYKQHLAYGGSKVISYTIVGGVFGLIGGIIAFSVGLRAGVAIFAGVFMIFYALGMFGFKFFRKFQFNPKFLTKFTMKASANAKGPYKGPVVTGLLNGLFIACGPLQAMYIYAAGTGSFAGGATSLAVFGLGTLPIMIGFGTFATVISHKTTQKILKISAVIVLILGLIMLNRGLSMIGSPYSFSAVKSRLTGNSIVGGAGAVLTNGVQEVNMDVSGSGYSPNSFVIKKGVPVKWNVNVKQLTGCNQELVLNKYGIDKNLKQGLNVIEFTPDKEGTITFSCGMGMLKGSFIVTESGTASQEQVKAATPPKGMQCGGSSGGGCGCGG